MEFAEALKRFRESRGLSQMSVATTLGLKPAQYQRYEWGKNSPSVDIVIKMAEAFDVSADYLLGLSDEPQRFDAQEVRDAFALRDAVKKLIAQ